MTAIPQHSSATNEHPTPPEVVEPARRLLGRFDLDPASTPEINRTIGADKIFTIADDGLAQTWGGSVFLNPPGGRLKLIDGRWVPVKAGAAESSMKVWWDALARKWGNGEVRAAFFVGFTLEILRTSQSCRFPIQAFPRCYPARRLAFQGDDPTHANVLAYLPPVGLSKVEALARLRREFDSLGFCEGGA